MTDKKINSPANIATSFIWKFMERIVTQVINLIIQIVLARLISPEEFGSLAVLVVFINISTVFVQKGLSSSLIRKKETDSLDYNTAFTVSVLVASLLYIMLFICAPYIAQIYESVILQSSLRVLGINIIFGALYCIQNVILVRHTKFKLIFIRGLVSTIISGGLGILLALKGYGLWALVVQSLSNQIILCFIGWNEIDWKPKFQFSYDRIKEILSFGGKVLISELIAYVIESIRTLIIGKKYTTVDLAYYDRGQIYPATIMRSIYDTISSVLLPLYSKKQDEPSSLATAMYKTIDLCMFISTPIFVGLAAVSETVVKLLLTEKWMGCVPFLMVFCIYQIPYPIQGITRQILYARGKSNLVLIMEIIKGLIIIITMFISLQISVFAVAISASLTSYIITVINLVFTKNVIPIKIVNIIKSLKNTFMYNIVMFIMVYCINYINVTDIAKIIAQITIGIISYIGIAYMSKDENFMTCQIIMKQILKK